MARRLSFDERARIEAMNAAGLSVEETARRLDRHPVTVYRELARCGRRDGYDAEAAQADAEDKAARPKTLKLVSDPGLADVVGALLGEGMSPHAASAELRSHGRRVCGETIYRACYDHTGRSGLDEGLLAVSGPRPAAAQTAGPVHAKAQPAGCFQADSGPSRSRVWAQRGRALGGRLDHRQGQPLSGG